MSRVAESAGPAGPFSADAYRMLVEQVRETAARCVAPGGTVAVVSRGDEELLRLGAVRACHFPVDGDGQYAGYHPATGADAVAHLEELRAAGVDHLLIPRTAFWWLDHYDELAEHLASEWELLSGETGACRIYGRPGGGGPGPRGRPVNPHSVRQQLAFLESVLPTGASLAVVGGAGADALARLRPGSIALDPHRLDPWPSSDGDAVADAAAPADYLFVPAVELARPEIGERLVSALARRFRPLAWREHLGLLLDIRINGTSEST